MNAILLRTYYDNRTEGILVVMDNTKVVFSCNTLELPNLNNLPQKSCIPEGEYEVVRHTSPSKGDCYSVKNVPNRQNILIHVGNYTDDTLGCILVGTDVGMTIASSRKALTSLKKAAPTAFKLRIMSM